MKIRYTKYLLLLFILPLFAHPHVFIDCKPTLVFDSKGMRRAKIEWKFDEMYSFDILMSLTDGNSEITKDEFLALQAKFEEVFAPMSYHTHFIIDGNDFDIQEVLDFDASVDDDKRVVFKFTVPLFIKFKDDANNFTFSLYDDTRYYSLLPVDGLNIVTSSSTNVTYQNDNKITFKINFNRVMNTND